MSIKLGKKTIVENLSFDLFKQQWLMLIGPNGTGKSTTLKAISKNVSYAGDIFYKNKNIKDISNTEYAKCVGFLSQNNFVAYDFSIYDIVSMGRYSYKNSILSSRTNADEEKILDALDIVGLLDIKDKSVQELSGGEVQRTFLAQLFAQDPSILVLDEPTNNLDLVYQEQIFNILKKWISEKKVSVISVVHDLSLAKYYGDSAVLLDNNDGYRYGKISDVMHKSNLDDVYHMDVLKYMNNMLSQWN